MQGLVLLCGYCPAAVSTTQIDLTCLHAIAFVNSDGSEAVSYTHLRAHETVLDLVCRLLLDKKQYSEDYYAQFHTHPNIY